MMSDDVSPEIVSVPLCGERNPLARTETEALRWELVSVAGPFRAPMLLPEAYRAMAHRLILRLDDHRGDPWALSDADVFILDADVRLFSKRLSAAKSAVA